MKRVVSNKDSSCKTWSSLRPDKREEKHYEKLRKVVKVSLKCHEEL